MNKETHDTSDRRCATRYALSWPVLLEDGEGHTRDISTTGVYFETDCLLALDSLIRFVLLLPDPQNTTKNLRCEGRVVRVDQREASVGIGVQISDFCFA